MRMGGGLGGALDGGGTRGGTLARWSRVSREVG